MNLIDRINRIEQLEAELERERGKNQKLRKQIKQGDYCTMGCKDCELAVDIKEIDK